LSQLIFEKTLSLDMRNSDFYCLNILNEALMRSV